MKDTPTFRLIERISNLLRSEERKQYAALGLQPVHFQLLDYLTRCNQFSNTPVVVAEYLGLTKGTVSKSIQLLERKNYLLKLPDANDRRVTHLQITPQGEQLLNNIRPIDVFAKAQQSISNQNFTSLDEALHAILCALQKANNTKSFGVCHTCSNFIKMDDHFLCNLTQLPLNEVDSIKICREHRLNPAILNTLT